MLTSSVLTLRPQTSCRIAAGSGKVIHGSFMALIASVDGELVERLDAKGGAYRKPFTLSPLWSQAERSGLEWSIADGEVFHLRITALEAETAEAISLAVAIGEMEIGRRRLRDGSEVPGLCFDIVRHSCTPSETGGWGDSTTFEQIWHGARRDQDIEMGFTSPCAFKDGDRDRVFPLADSVFGSYARAWRAISPIPLPVEFDSRIRENVQEERFRLRSADPHLGERGRMGFVGDCRYRIVSKDSNFVRALNALADFALYCGTGKKTTMGMGQTRRLSV